ncbi:MAG TPA: TolC family outer membrane protein [Arenimonas sp.]|nr:TolC family outer membrane protein [Arenimonas sp.]
MRLRPLAFAFLLAGLAGNASAADLMQAYELARDSDPQLAAAEAQMLGQGEGVVQSRSALLPQLTGSASLSRSDGDSSSISINVDENDAISFGPSSGGSDTTTRSYSLDLRQSLYDHGNYARLDAAKARAKQAEADYRAAADGLVVRVADAYFAVLTAIESLASSRAEERAVKRQLDQAEKRLEVGLAPITDVHEARARFDAARANAIAAANALDDAREALAEITGKPLENLRGLSPDFKPEHTDTRGAAYWVDQALGGNPSLLARELALTAAEEDVSSARAGHLPTLSATASLNDRATWGTSTSNANTIPATSASDGHTVGVTLSVPLFSGFATQSRVRQALHTRDAASEQLEQQRRAVTRQTRNAYRALVAGAAEVEARRLSVVSAQAAYEASEAGLEVGTRTIVDVLITQQSLFQAQREYARARHAFLVNELRLKQAAGNIGVNDLEAVNRSLVHDAEAALADLGE